MTISVGHSQIGTLPTVEVEGLGHLTRERRRDARAPEEVVTHGVEADGVSGGHEYPSRELPLRRYSPRGHQSPDLTAEPSHPCARHTFSSLQLGNNYCRLRPFPTTTSGCSLQPLRCKFSNSAVHLHLTSVIYTTIEGFTQRHLVNVYLCYGYGTMFASTTQKGGRRNGAT